MLLCGCVTNGDFGRVRPELVNDDMHSWIGRDALGSVRLPPSDYPLTDQEQTLRDLAYPLIEPPYDRNRWDSVWREYGLGREPRYVMTTIDPPAYWIRLKETNRRSEASAYAQIITDARNDVVRTDPFFVVAGRVADMDGKRAKAAAHVAGLSAYEHQNARIRNIENSLIVRWVCRSLKARAVAYRFALERLAVAAPAAAAAEADRSLSLLASKIGQYCGGGGASAAAVSKG